MRPPAEQEQFLTEERFQLAKVLVLLPRSYKSEMRSKVT